MTRGSGEAPALDWMKRGGLALIIRSQGPDGQEGHLPGCLASPTEAGRAGGRPLLHEALLLGSRNALWTTEHAETPENRDFEASSWGPPHDEPFRAT